MFTMGKVLNLLWKVVLAIMVSKYKFALKYLHYFEALKSSKCFCWFQSFCLVTNLVDRKDAFALDALVAQNVLNVANHTIN